MSRRPGFPGKLPPGAKVLATRLPAERIVRLAPLQPAGSLIVAFEVEGRPVPWSVPPKIRRKNPKLTAWQQIVRAAARQALVIPGPYPGPIELVLAFHLTPRYARSDKGMPDLTNLQKGLEDSLNKVCYVDDSQVVRITSTKTVGSHNGAFVAVYVAGRETP